MRKFLLALALVACALPSWAANHYIRQGGSGSTAGTGNCADWSAANACANAPATLVRGDTYYFAAGTYGGYDFTTPNSGTTRITWKKATVADHGIATGWLDSYASAETFFNRGGSVFVCHENVGYITLDGVYGTKGVTGSFGFRMQSTDSRATATAMWDVYMGGQASSMGNCDGWTLNYIDIDWNNGTSSGSASGGTRGIWLRGGIANDNFTLSNSWLHHSSAYGMYVNTFGSGLTIINSRFSNNGGCGGTSCHHETFWINPASNVVIDGNEIIDTLVGDLTGWLMIGNVTNVRISNNLFYCTNTAICMTGGNGIIGTWSSTPSNNGVYIYNNTFANLPAGGNYIYINLGTNIHCVNNLVYSAEFSWTGCGTAGTFANNACGGGAACSGTTPQTGITTAIFRDWANKDLHLTQHTTAGTNMSATYTLDKDGVVRTVWDRGAYEFGAHYVLQGAGGTASGNDWTNAYTALPASLPRGHTYYVADGTYGAHVFNDALSGSTLIYIKKATAASHGTDVGWTAAMGDGEAMFTSATPVWRFDTGYYDIDGVVGAGKASTPYGFHLRPSSSRCVNEFSSAIMFQNVSTLAGLRISRLDADWLPATTNCTANVPALLTALSGPTADITMDHLYFHDAPGYAMYFGGYLDAPSQGDDHSRWKIQYSYFVNLGGGGGPDHHFEPFWQMNVNDTDFRYNWLENEIDGTGAQTGWLMIAKADNYRVYGNVFTCSTAACSVGGNGVIATWSSDNYVNNGVYVINNTFVNVTSSTICDFNDCGARFTHNSASDAAIVFKNNLYFNPIFTWSGLTTQAYEACGGGQPCSGTNQQTGILNSKFLNYAGANYHLSSATTAGDATVGAPYNVDPDGVVRGADGTWDRGAFEYAGGGGGAPPQVLNFRKTAP